jgi:enterochelin esterase-like enzyme
LNLFRLFLGWSIRQYRAGWEVPFLTVKKTSSLTPAVNGEHVTFHWYGPRAPILIGDFNEWEASRDDQLKRVGKNHWALSRDFAPGSYLEYAYLLDGERQLDPLNPRTASTDFDSVNNYFYLAPGAPTPLARKMPQVPQGQIESYWVDASSLRSGARRKVYLYRPDAEGPFPLVIVYDGPQYLRRARLATQVDNLIDQRRIRPIAMAFLTNGAARREIEYACSDATLEFIMNAVLPLASQELDLLAADQANGAYGVMGASMGGLMALYTGVRLTHIFGHVLSQSGAFFPESVIHDLVDCRTSQGLKTWLDVGLYESLLEMNRDMQARLASRQYQVVFEQYPGGHNYTAWRNQVWRGLEYLFPQ